MILPLLVMLWSPPKIIERPFRVEKRRDVSDNIVVIHYDSSPDIKTTLRYLKRKGNAYHYCIDRDGTIYKMIDPKYEARHAGFSYFRGHVRLNHYSIGICLVGSGLEEYTDQQYDSLSWLIKLLKRRYPDITDDKVVGHSDIAIPRGRKLDPGPLFNWTTLRILMHYGND